MPLVRACAVVIQYRQADGGEQNERHCAVMPPQENARRFQAGGAYVGERSLNQMNHLRARGAVPDYPDSFRLMRSKAVFMRERFSDSTRRPRQRFSVLEGRASAMP